ncbi:MAG: class I SAM-dependent methyltransferase [Sphingobium sp.]
MITAQRAIKAAGKHVSRGLLALRAGLGARADRHCPACGADVVGFFRYGAATEWGCPACLASPRERLVNHLVGQGVLKLPEGGAILHMAPNEASLVARFSAAAADYVPADLDPSRYAVENVRRVDLMDIGAEERFDLFYASHVMEHVPDDAHVLRNVFAALKPGGEAWLVVPLWNRPSEDGAPDMSTSERERRFGQWDHARQYGEDFADRICSAGFEVDLLRASQCEAADIARMALDDVIFRARKPANRSQESA